MTVLLGASIAGWIFIQSGSNNYAHDSRSGRNASPAEWKQRLAQRGLAELRHSQARGLAPLMASHDGPEGMPMALRRSIAKNLQGVDALHLRFARARHERTPIGVGLWVVEGEGVTCLFREDSPASSCRTSLATKRQGIWLETYKISKAQPGRPSHFLALGAVPEGVRAMSATIAGSPRTVPVRNDVWAVRAESPISSIRAVRAIDRRRGSD